MFTLVSPGSGRGHVLVSVEYHTCGMPWARFLLTRVFEDM